MNCFRYLGLRTLDEVDELTMKEYRLRIEAYQLQKLDAERDRHRSVWLSRMVDATDKKGNYVFKTFDEFWNEKKMRIQLGIDSAEELKKESQKRKRMADIAKMANSQGVKARAKES